MVLKGCAAVQTIAMQQTNYSGPAQGFTIISTVPYANILLLAVHLVPAKLRVQIEFPLTVTQVSGPQNLKLSLHHERFSNTINYHAKPHLLMHRNNYAGNVTHASPHKTEYTPG